MPKEPARHACPQCKQKFTRVSSVNRHVQAVHQNDKPYACPYHNCDYATNQRPNLKRHINAHKKREQQTKESCDFQGPPPASDPDTLALTQEAMQHYYTTSQPLVRLQYEQHQQPFSGHAQAVARFPSALGQYASASSASSSSPLQATLHLAQPHSVPSTVPGAPSLGPSSSAAISESRADRLADQAAQVGQQTLLSGTAGTTALSSQDPTPLMGGISPASHVAQVHSHGTMAHGSELQTAVQHRNWHSALGFPSQLPAMQAQVPSMMSQTVYAQPRTEASGSPWLSPLQWPRPATSAVGDKPHATSSFSTSRDLATRVSTLSSPQQTPSMLSSMANGADTSSAPVAGGDILSLAGWAHPSLQAAAPQPQISPSQLAVLQQLLEMLTSQRQGVATAEYAPAPSLSQQMHQMPSAAVAHGGFLPPHTAGAAGSFHGGVVSAVSNSVLSPQFQ